MTTPRLSIIVPVRDAADDLANCLTALASSAFDDYEIIVVDDGSLTTPNAAVRAHARARLFTQTHRGPAAARNRGAEEATGEVLVFLDADTMPHTDVLTRIANQFDLHPELAALFGSYDTSPTALQLVSQYRNLHHHFIHQDQSQNATTFWAGCGAIRRDVFHAIGGFNVEYTRPCIEDIELGTRLAKQGHKIRLDRDMLVTHGKRWTMMKMIATDVRDRAAPWTRLIVAERSMPRGLNLHWSQRLSAVLTWLMLLLLVCQVFNSPWAVGLACLVLPLIALLDPITGRRGWKQVVQVGVACVIFGVPVSMAIRAPVAAALLVTVVSIVVWLNRRFYRFLMYHRGFAFACCCLPLHLMYYVYASLTFACEFCRFRLGSRPQRKPERQGAQPCR